MSNVQGRRQGEMSSEAQQAALVYLEELTYTSAVGFPPFESTFPANTSRQIAPVVISVNL